MSRFRRVGIVAVVAALTVPQIVGASADDPPGPVLPSWAAAFVYSITLAPHANTPGGNDWSCQTSAAHPRPVVLVHGTVENRYDDWAWMAPQLKAAGHCVFALNYGDDDSLASFPPGIYGIGDIRNSAQELAVFVDQVLAATGATQVDMVGHSQGGMMPRQYLKFEGGANPDDPNQNKVHTLVTIGGSHHGTTVDGLNVLIDAVEALTGLVTELSPAVEQQIAGSEFLQELNAGGDTMPGVNYVVIGSRYDFIVTPYQSTFLTAGPGATVQNVTVQDGCSLDLSSHTSMVTSPRVNALVKNALDAAHPVPVPCTLHLPEV